MQPILLKPLFHRGGEQIGIYFENDTAIKNTVKRIKGIKWSQTQKCWYVPLNHYNIQCLPRLLNDHATVNTQLLQPYVAKKERVEAADSASLCAVNSKPPMATTAWELSRENLKALSLLVQELKLKAYSASTVKTYRNEFLQLLLLLKNKHVNDLTPDHLKRYMLYCMEKQGIKENTAHSRLNALKFYFEQVLRRDKFFLEIPRLKKMQQLPKFFNQDEITSIIKAVGNLKHKTMLMLAYSSGLRVSEVVSIKTRNIDSKRKCILVEQAKGKKDRMVPLSAVLLIMLREYWQEYKPQRNGFLFEGQDKQEPYSTRSLQLVLAAAKKKAGIIKPGSIHALRHSFATHLLDRGTDVTIIMKLLGHNDIKTTLRYLHVTNRDIMQVISPLDCLNMKG